ncbi:MAG: hypothetical protein ACOY93_10250 [Bacillota bacterium]
MEQYEDKDLAYTLILESRLTHPAADAFVMKFCSRNHVQEFLSRIRNQGQKYVLTRILANGEQTFPADSPLELLLLVGSSKAS